MSGLNRKFTTVFFVSLFVTVLLGCDDEKKEICCHCKCYSLNDSTTSTVEKEKQNCDEGCRYISDGIFYEEFTVSGMNLNCDKECRYRCEDDRSLTLGNQAKVNCPANTESNP